MQQNTMRSSTKILLRTKYDKGLLSNPHDVKRTTTCGFAINKKKKTKCDYLPILLLKWK